MKKQCNVCGHENGLQTHHISYDPEMTIALCVDCHEKVHNHGVGRPKGHEKYPILLQKIVALMCKKFGVSEVAEMVNPSYSTILRWRGKHQKQFMLSKEQEEWLDENVDYEYEDYSLSYLAYPEDCKAEDIPI